MTYTITVFAKPASRENNVEKIGNAEFRVSVKEPPIQGRANAAVIALLAEYFNVSRAQIQIIRGHASREKIIRISTP
ncbi:MAG: DUF167 domain-containing protein [Candidatus Sungbacteria bacterium]|nr:DUF167 domain-containing protein [Candidatus Sungbacteria bacterium]